MFAFDTIKAPQFVDFTKAMDSESDDSFFEMYREGDKTHDEINETMFPQQLEETVLIGKENENHALDDHLYAAAVTPMRRSMSVGDINYLRIAIERINRDNAASRAESAENSVAGPSRTAHVPRIFVSEDNLDNSANYVPLTEAIRNVPYAETKPKQLKPTVPHSPHLISRQRNRAHHVLSREEEERLQLEEAQRNQFKAHPVNKKILQKPPVKPKVNEKKCTVPEPFKLTEIKPKTATMEQQDEKFQFHARPAPKFNKVPLPVVQTVKPTKPAKTKLPNEVKAAVKKVEAPKRTQPLPFSFEARHQALAKKKENVLRQVMEEEKKAREFHAKPIPKGLLKPSNCASSLPSTSRVNNLSEVAPPTFKARPATVLHKKPFQPKKGVKPKTKVEEFSFSTDQRTKAWEDFERQLKENETRFEIQRRAMEEKKRQQEEEEIKRLRKMAEYVAQPVRKYKKIEIKHVRKITEPKSPNFVSRSRKEKNKENMIS